MHVQCEVCFMPNWHARRLVLADDAGAKRKYRELKRLPADIRAQVALLKVRQLSMDIPVCLCRMFRGYILD